MAEDRIPSAADTRVIDAARQALSECQCPEPEVLGAVGLGLAAVPAPADGGPVPAVLSGSSHPLQRRSC